MAQAPAEAPQPNASSNGGHDGSRGVAHGSFWALVIGSVGVVYGDIGTSPLYAFKESLAHVLQDGTPATREEVLGQKPSVLKSGFTSDAEYKKMWEAISSGQEWHGEFFNKKKK